MKLNFDIIIDHLPKSYNVKQLGLSYPRRTLNMPVIFEPESEYRKELLYVVSGDLLPQTPPSKGLSVVCFGQKPSRAWEQGNCHILWIEDGPSFYSVFNEINKVFETFNRWEKNIIQEIARVQDFDIRKILITGVKMMENPMSVVNSTLVVLFRILLEDCDKENTLNITIDQANHSVYPIEQVKDACRVERALTESYFSSVGNLGYRIYCKNLFIFDRFAGCISISEQHRPFRASDIALADYFFSFFQEAFSKYIQTVPSVDTPEIALLKNVINNTLTDTKKLAPLSLDQEDYWTCFVLQYNDQTSSMPINSMSATLNVLMPDTVISVVRDDEIWGLLKLHQDASNDSELKCFEDFITKMNYVAGMSCACYDVSQALIYFNFAKCALELGYKPSNHDHIYYFNDYALEYIITRYSAEYPAEHLYPSGLRLLIEHDKKSSVNYIQTLQIFLENQMNISKTADALFIHRSSLISRFDKINELLKTDLAVPENRLYIQLCLYLLTKEK